MSVTEAAQPKWQPIETVPKKRRVLLTNGELIATGRYRLPTIFDIKKEVCYDSGLTKSDATHWMPLPQPPKEQ